jgi:hypothetical protein
MRTLLIIFSFFLLHVSVDAKPRVLPQQQAAHFCRLLLNDGEGRIYPLKLYATRLTTLLYAEPRHAGFSAEQVFTGLIFFYDDWAQEPMALGDGRGRMLMEELHSGQTLRIFPHVQGKHATWYAPTDRLPSSVDDEHQKYISEVFDRLNAVVHEGNWKLVDDFIDKMIQYQCRFGGKQK